MAVTAPSPERPRTGNDPSASPSKEELWCAPQTRGGRGVAARCSTHNRDVWACLQVREAEVVRLKEALSKVREALDAALMVHDCDGEEQGGKV